MVRIAVAADNLGSSFPGLVYARLKKLAGPDQVIVECATQGSSSPELARARLLGLLRGEPKPIALIAISIRPDPVSLAAFREVRAPVVLVDEELEGTSTVAVDNALGGYLAGAHLAAAGRTRIAVLAGVLDVQAGMNSTARLEGFRKALAERGLAPAAVLHCRYARKDGVAALDELLAYHRGVDAVFCAAGDLCAAGVLSAARERGLKVPGDLAVVGFDDNAVAAISDPPLTTIRQPLQRLADEAFRLATAETAALLARPQRVIFPPQLVVRASG